MVTGWNKMLKSIRGWLICSSFTHYLGDKHLLLCQIFDTDLPLLAFSRHMLRKPSLTPCLIILFALNNLCTQSFLFSLATVFFARGTMHTGKLELTNFSKKQRGTCKAVRRHRHPPMNYDFSPPLTIVIFRNSKKYNVTPFMRYLLKKNCLLLLRYYSK